jgi:hypothetical protein
MPLPAGRNPHVKSLPASADLAETVERILSRRQLAIHEGDVLICRAHGGLVSSRRPLYELHLSGRSVRPERFATFEHAAARGEELATQHRVRLFYTEDEQHDLPRLLKDARTT